MDPVKQACREVAQTPGVMTFSEAAQAAANGAVVGQRSHQPIIGAILGLSVAAGKRAVMISEELIKQLAEQGKDKDGPKSDAQPKVAIRFKSTP